MSGHEDADEVSRRFGRPYGQKHPIPTVQKYREEKEARERLAQGPSTDEEDTSKTDHAKSTWQQYSDWWSGAEQPEQPTQPDSAAPTGKAEQKDGGDDSLEEYDDVEPAVDTSEVAGPADTKAKRKGMKKRGDGAERQVTDPITHLPVTIRDFNTAALQEVPENEPPFGSTPRTATGLSNRNKSNKQMQKEWHELEKTRESTEALFPPPQYEGVRDELVSINRSGALVTAGGTVVLFLSAFLLERYLQHSVLPRVTKDYHNRKSWAVYSSVWLGIGLTTSLIAWFWVAAINGWVKKRVDSVWQDSVWEANRKSMDRQARAHENETVAWLNSLISSVWPLINPDLFTSLADMLEDVMQASIPSIVQMVSVDDIGQGSESIRILGIRWLPTGAAARAVGEDGKLQAREDKATPSDRTMGDQGDVDENVQRRDNATDNSKKDEENESGDDKAPSTDGTDKQVGSGMEAEEGDFINLEVSFAYRARSSETFKDRTRDMHLYLSFYLFGNVKIPIWVDLRGVIGTMRLRLQLGPDPPFFGLCTLTFLGQPKVDISCIPLLKRGLNIMDLPLISNFVQSSVDAAMSEYVAPKSLTLDLKDMLAGDDFKKDTIARGVLVVHIKRGYDFREGDPGIPLIKEGGADPYVSVGWAKFGKPLFSTRILLKEMQPYWYETAYLLVGPQELDVDERLRLQLWDSDRMSADDDLGRIEVDLKTIMKDDESNGRMTDRSDGFRALKRGEPMPGKLDWSVGYFSKVRLQEDQFEKQSYDKKIRNMEDLDKKVDAICRRQLREAIIKDGKNSAEEEGEFHQNKQQELKRWQDSIRISAPPPEGYYSGIFSIQVHQITRLGLEKLNKSRDDEGAEADDEEEQGEGLPSAYCTVVINHNKAFKTRTKPKNAKPFYNAGTERFISDYRNAEVFVTVRDARLKETDPLLGIVHLPLGQVFAERSQINGFYPLVGGIGYGRIRLSMVWTSVQMQAPPKELGWEYGTLEIEPELTTKDVPQEFRDMKIKFFTDIGAGKMKPHKDNNSQTVWQTHQSRRTGKRSNLRLPVRKHYSSCLSLEFRKNGMFGDRIGAFAVLWLRNIPDEEQEDVTLDVWKETKSGNDCQRAKTCALAEGGVDLSPEKIGTLTLKMTLWSGMGSAHAKWAAKKDQHTRDVMEVLECAKDNYESHQTAKDAGIVDDDEGADGDDSSSNDDDSSEEETDAEGVADGNGIKKLKKKLAFKKGDDAADKSAKHEAAENAEEGGRAKEAGKSKQNIFDAATDYKKDMKSKHRKNRGIMQYRLPRTAQFAMRKVESAGDSIKGLFEHKDREPGIETEV